MGTAATLVGGVRVAGRCQALGHWPRVRRRARCHCLAAVAVVPCIDASQRRRAEAGGARGRAGFKGDLVVELRLVDGQRQEGAVVVAAHGLGSCAVVMRRRTRRGLRRGQRHADARVCGWSLRVVT